MKGNSYNKNKDILRQIHKDTPVYVPFMLIMKKDFTINYAFYFFAYLFRFIGIFVLTGNFIIDPIKIKENKSFAQWARYITSYQLVKLLNLSNQSYAIISLIIFILFLTQNIIYLFSINKYRESDSLEKAETNKLQIIFDHLLFLFYPFLLEYLSFIYYIEFLPNKFIIKKDSKMNIINIIIAIINTIVIVGFNFHSFIHIISVNRSMNEEELPIKYRYSNKKFWIIFLMHNFVLLECMPLYLEQNSLKAFKIITYGLIGLIYLCLFFSSLKNFNYQTTINTMVELCSYFSFFHIICEIIMTFLDYNITSYLTLLFLL